MGLLRQFFGLAPDRPHVVGQLVPWLNLQKEFGLVARSGKWWYGVLRSDYLPGLMKRTQDTLQKSGGIARWAPTATCTLYASRAVDLCAEEYYMASFHDVGAAPAPAIAEFWYMQGGKSGHAIVAAYTERGLEFYDPQLGAKGKIDLTPAERSSVYHVRFL